MSSFAQVCFVNCILHKNLNDYISEPSVCVYAYMICEDIFGGCKKSFSWLSQKLNKTIDGGDTFGHDADGFASDLRPWSRDDAMSWQDISTPFDILIELEASEYSYSICVRNFENIRFELNSRFVPSLLHCAVVMATVQSTFLADRTLCNFSWEWFSHTFQPYLR